MVRPIKPEFNLPKPQPAPAPKVILVPPAAQPVAAVAEKKPRTSGNKRIFAAIVTLIFLIWAIFNVWHHAMWRDELRAWQIAAASATPADLRFNLRFEGTPMLWYLIVWGLTKITVNVFAEQLVHVLIASGVVFVFCFAAPFARWIRVLFCFGYFPFFEYATISRSYSLVFLFLLIGIALLCAERSRPIAIGIMAAVLAQVSVWGAGFGVMLMLTAAVRWILLERGQEKIAWKWWGIAAVLVVISCAMAYVGMRPGPGPSVLTTWDPAKTAGDKLIVTIDSVWKAWAPLPRWTRNWWNTNVLDAHLVVALVCSIILILIAILSLLDRPVALLFFGMGTLGLLGFTFFEFGGTTRHCGHLFMVLVAACWIAQKSKRMQIPNDLLRRVSEWFDAHRPILLSIVLATSVVGGVGANIADVRSPFSASRATADYIRSKYPADLPLSGFDDWCVTPVGALLGRPIYSFQMKATVPFQTQDDAARSQISLEAVANQLLVLNLRSNKDVLLLLSSSRHFEQKELVLQFPPSAFGPQPTLHISYVTEFNDSTVEDEAETLYLVHAVQ
jgi:hypothetical protein